MFFLSAVRCVHAKTASSEVGRVSWRVMAQGREDDGGLGRAGGSVVASFRRC